MLVTAGPAKRFCDGLSRRSFLSIGALGLGAGALTLPELMAAEERAGARRSKKSVIMVYLSGGLAHQDSFDLKPDAPAEVRGEFNPIDTVVPGVRVCELMPKLARTADRYSVVRSIVGLRDEHSSFQTITGYGMNESQRDGKPHFCSFASRLLGPIDPVIPPFVDLFPTMQHRPYNSPSAGALGDAYGGVKADSEDLANMKPRFFTLEGMGDRRKLLTELDSGRRAIDAAAAGGVDASWRRAYEVLASSKLVEAMDLDREEAAVRDRYGRGSNKHQGDGAPLWNDQLLMARRLVEAGVRCVTVAYGFWDTHGNNFSHLKGNLPKFDEGISALVEDLYARGLDRDVSLVVWGEFGRTPKINASAGRDHWAPVNCALVAGGGMKTGQFIGSTDKIGAYAQSRPIHYHDVLATLYNRMGIDHHAFVRDRAERPISLLPGAAKVIEELV